MPDHPGPGVLEVLGPVLTVVVVVAYTRAAGGLEGRRWPWWRTACWVGGTGCVLAAVSGPLAHAGHRSFTAHMGGHLLLGMVGPLLLVCAAPVTLLLRSLPAPRARVVVRVLRSRPARAVTHPGVAAVLDVGGLWLLYSTGLMALAHRSPWAGLAVAAHVLAAGWLFTAAVLAVDPVARPRSHALRAVVLVLAAAAHGVLAKRLYAHPPPGVHGDTRPGAMLMYYGGDAVEVALLVLLLLGWYRASDPRRGARSTTRAGTASVLES